MDQDSSSQTSARATVLVVMLSCLLGGSCLWFLVAVTSGVILLVALGFAALGGVAFVHYLVWGKSLTQATEGDREEAKLRDLVDAEEWDLPPPRNHRHR
jgi:hypothetical protein